ncbi:MAG: 3-dehydro-L-gulonate 2-dehydrogenase [Prolixibacteraceae bacterium]|nr:3-dehydro-L-gulonate 2-dehydrogenase [Prolixibacteraceae bacterium]
MIRVSFREMESRFLKILLKYGLPEEKAKICAGVFSENSLDGIYSHGVYRFPRFIEYIEKGYVDANAGPELVHSAGAIEQWKGNLAPGILNALFCTDRAISIAEKSGMGCVAIAGTNHWMRGGTYGWNAAKRGYAFIGWTNTEANMPAWGAKDSRLGNNPLVFAVPFGNEAIVLDLAMTQFSYGKMEAVQLQGDILPFQGGYNTEGKLTSLPGEILESMRALPIGYWKGSGLSFLLDILATILSGGLSTHQLSKQEAEYGVSQVFIVFDIKKLHNYPSIQSSIRDITEDLKNSVPDEEGGDIRYPGERVIKTRRDNLRRGIPVNKDVWDAISELLNPL